MMWLTIMHLAFVVSALMLGFLENLMSVTSKNDLKRQRRKAASSRTHPANESPTKAKVRGQ